MKKTRHSDSQVQGEAFDSSLPGAAPLPAETPGPASSASSDSDQLQYLRQQNTTLKGFMARLGSLGFYERNNETGEVTVNDFWQSCGYGSGYFKGLEWLKVVHPEDLDRVKAVFRLPSDKDEFRMEFRVRARSGEWRWVLTRGLILARDSERRAVQYIGIDTDITEQKENEEELRLQKAAAEQRALEADTLRMVGAVVASGVDPDHAVVRILEQAKQVLPFDFARAYRSIDGSLELIGMANADGQAVEQVQVLGPRDPGPHSQVLIEEQALIFNKVHQLFPERVIDGRIMRSWLGVPIFMKGHLGGMLSFETVEQDFYNDSHLRIAISFADYVGIALENARLYQELKSLSITDELTGLLSRRWIQDYAQRLLEQSIRKQNDLSVFMIDVDWFKRINDSYGHIFGDKVLRTIAVLCADRLRAGDIMCRYGGEEFLAVLPQTNIQEAWQVAERLRQSVAELVFEGLDRPVTISIGISTLNGRIHDSLYELIHEADTALYSAKRKGRNQTVVAEFPGQVFTPAAPS